MHCVILHPKETTRNVILPVAFKTLPDVAAVGIILRRTISPDYIGEWKWNDISLHLFAYKTGKAGTENKHELPPPYDTVLLFGEAAVIATKNDQIVNFTGSEYMKFYNESMGGFEDLGSEDSEEEEEEEEELSEKEEIVEEEEEPEPEPEPIVQKVIKPKRGNKKLPTWFTKVELEKEEYTL